MTFFIIRIQNNQKSLAKRKHPIQIAISPSKMSCLLCPNSLKHLTFKSFMISIRNMIKIGFCEVWVYTLWTDYRGSDILFVDSLEGGSCYPIRAVNSLWKSFMRHLMEEIKRGIVWFWLLFGLNYNRVYVAKSVDVLYCVFKLEMEVCFSFFGYEQVNFDLAL